MYLITLSDTRTHARTHAHTYTHTHTYTQTRTRTHAQAHARAHTHILGRTSLDEEASSRRRDLCLKRRNIYKRQISILFEGFEPAVTTSERPQTERPPVLANCIR